MHITGKVPCNGFEEIMRFLMILIKLLHLTFANILDKLQCLGKPITTCLTALTYGNKFFDPLTTQWCNSILDGDDRFVTATPNCISRFSYHSPFWTASNSPPCINFKDIFALKVRFYIFFIKENSYDVLVRIKNSKIIQLIRTRQDKKELASCST